MKSNLAIRTGAARSALLQLGALVALTIACAAATDKGIGGNRRWRESLEGGDIVFVDSGNALVGGGLFKLNPQTGERTPISVGGLLRMPFGVTVDARTGLIVVSDSGRIIAVDPVTGDQTVAADNADDKLGLPFGIDFDPRGNLLIANAQAIVQMDAREDQLQVVAAGGHMSCPVGLAVGRDGNLYVANLAFPAEIVRVDARTGAQVVVARGDLLNRPQALAIDGDQLYVTDVTTADGNFGEGRVIRVDATTGEQSVVSEGGYLVGPVGISVAADGQLIVADPYTINPESPELFDGAVMRIDPATGKQTLLARGADDFVNPRGVAIVPRMSHAGSKPGTP